MESLFPVLAAALKGFNMIAFNRYLGCKWTVAVSFICYMPYIGAQFYPKFSTMIPAGILVGLGGAPLWVGKCTYLSVAAEAYKEVSGVATDVLTVRFFGIFFMIFQFSQVWGNLISSTVFSTESHTVNNMTGDLGDICGANFLPGEDAGPAAIPPSKEKVYTVAGIYLACMALACATVGFTVDSLKRYFNAIIARKPQCNVYDVQ